MWREERLKREIDREKEEMMLKRMCRVNTV